MTKVVAIALDTFHDNRCGFVAAGKKVELSKSAAEDLEKAGLIKLTKEKASEDTDEGSRLSSEDRRTGPTDRTRRVTLGKQDADEGLDEEGRIEDPKLEAEKQERLKATSNVTVSHGKRGPKPKGGKGATDLA